MELKEDNGLRDRRRPLRKDKNFLQIIVLKMLYDIGNIANLKDDEKKLYNEIENYLKREKQHGFIEGGNILEVRDVSNKIIRIFLKIRIQ